MATMDDIHGRCMKMTKHCTSLAMLLLRSQQPLPADMKTRWTDLDVMTEKDCNAAGIYIDLEQSS